MGRVYSVKGFLNAALRRSGKTLLVEGPSDKLTMHRLCIDLPEDATFVIDHAEMLGDDVSSIGNKDRVLAVRDEAARISNEFPKLKTALAVLTDREWDDLPSGVDRFREAWNAPTQGNNSFITLGHSIENYSFTVEHASEFLKLNFSDILSQGSIRLVEENFTSMIASAACLSLAYQEAEVLRRSKNLLNSNSFNIEAGAFYLRADVANLLMNRGVDEGVARNLVLRVNELVAQNISALLTNGFLHWLPHGHVGEDALWSCIAACLRDSGTSEANCERVIGTVRNQGRTFFAHLLSKADRESIFPLKDVVNWISRN